MSGKKPKKKVKRAAEEDGPEPFSPPPKAIEHVTYSDGSTHTQCLACGHCKSCGHCTCEVN